MSSETSEKGNKTNEKIFRKTAQFIICRVGCHTAAIFLTAIYYYMQVIAYRKIDDTIYYVYIPYCAAVCAVCAVYIIKQRQENAKPVKMWFSGFFLYALSEILLFFKILSETENIGNYTYTSELGSNLYYNQPLYGFYLCAAAIFLLYCALYIAKRKKFYLVLIGANLLLFCLFIVFAPDTTEFLFSGYESSTEVIGVVFLREIGVLTLMLNMFAFALYEFYNRSEK